MSDVPQKRCATLSAADEGESGVETAEDNAIFTNSRRSPDSSLIKMIWAFSTDQEIFMGSAIPLGEFKDVMLDIESELQYWCGNYAQASFHRTPRSFDQYLPTLKFGYDMYLLNGGQGLEELLPAMRARYEAALDDHRRLEWCLAEAVIRETWKRMRPEVNYRAKEVQRAFVDPRPLGPSHSPYRVT